MRLLSVVLLVQLISFSESASKDDEEENVFDSINANSVPLKPIDSHFADVVKEREAAAPAWKWIKSAQEATVWGKRSSALALSEYNKGCVAEQAKTTEWLDALDLAHKKRHDSSNNEANVDSAADEAVRLLSRYLKKQINKLGRMVERLNKSIKAANAIFSGAHMFKVADIFEHVFALRNHAMVLRTTDTYEDPKYHPIAPFQPAPSDDDDDNSEVSFIDLSTYTATMDGIADEMQHYAEKATEEKDLFMDSTMDHIQIDLEFWRSMKVQFEKERDVLAKIREDIMSLVNAHLDQLEAIEAVHADLGSVRKKAPGDAAAEDAEIQHGLVHSLKRHLDTVTQACLDGDKFVASHLLWKSDLLTKKADSSAAVADKISASNLAPDGLPFLNYKRGDRAPPSLAWRTHQMELADAKKKLPKLPSGPKPGEMPQRPSVPRRLPSFP